MKVAAALLAQLTLCLLVVAQSPIPPGGGGVGSGTNEPYNWTPPPYVPGLKMNISLPDGTNFHLSLLEADSAGKYAIYFSTNFILATWNGVLQGTNGQTNFTLPIPVSQSGFFRVARADQAVADAAGMSFYFLSGFVNTNIASAAVAGGPAAATAILVDSTNFAEAHGFHSVQCRWWTLEQMRARMKSGLDLQERTESFIGQVTQSRSTKRRLQL